MRLYALPLLLAIPACATMPNATETSAQVTAAIARADAAYWRAKPYAEALLPSLSAERQVQVRAAMATTEVWLARAKMAATIAEQLAALAEAERAMAGVVAP